MNNLESEALAVRLEDGKAKLTRTLSQMKLIELKNRDMNQRYKRASTNKKFSFRYNLRMRMSITSGIKLMYMQYLACKVEEVRIMEQDLQLLEAQQRQIQQAQANGNNGAGPSAPVIVPHRPQAAVPVASVPLPPHQCNNR